MLSLCASCGRLLCEDDEVVAEITSRFHVLKSTVTFALDKSAMRCNPDTLRHYSCQYPQGEPDGD